MNEITSRFAAMAERARQDESPRTVESQQPPSVAASSGPHQGRAFSGWPVRERISLDQRVADELASLDRDDLPTPALDLHDAPTPKPVSNDSRGRATAYVSGLIARYVDLRRSPYGYKVNVTAVLAHLRGQLALMMTDTPEGVSLCRRWDFLCGDLV